MLETTSKRVPPYPSHALFAQFINDLVHADTIPKQINKSIFPKLSHGNISSLLGALRYLKLIGNDGVPTESLEQLVAARSSPQILKPLVQEAYSFVFTDQFDLAQATAENLADRFQNQGLSGETVQKAVSFFIALTIDAGMPISGSLTRQRHPARTEPNRRRRSPAPEVPTAAPAVPSAALNEATATAEQAPLWFALYDLLDTNRMTPKEQGAILTILLYLKKKENAPKETVIKV